MINPAKSFLMSTIQSMSETTNPGFLASAIPAGFQYNDVASFTVAIHAPAIPVPRGSANILRKGAPAVPTFEI